MRWSIVFCCFLFATLANAMSTPGLDRPAVDKVLVVKSERKLLLLSRGEVLKSYRVSLGKQPNGPKRYQGDKRTPEGFYWIDWRKASDKYNLSMHISYPNQQDLHHARQKGLPAGDMIMIHGTPLDAEYPEWYFHTLDWTEGCIAMRNHDIREVWSLVKDGTLIEIRP
ncbi:L,D-transpeptidase family protein [Geopseudomonas aromaticivorans]